MKMKTFFFLWETIKKLSYRHCPMHLMFTTGSWGSLDMCPWSGGQGAALQVITNPTFYHGFTVQMPLPSSAADKAQWKLRYVSKRQIL